VKRFLASLTLLCFVLLTSFAASAYAHGLGQDKAPPVTVGEKQITVEGYIRPASVPLPPSFGKPILLIRTLDDNSNSTVAGIDYRITVGLRNDMLLDQRFRSSDGIILANLIPDKDVSGWQITDHESATQEDQIEVSQGSPVEIRSAILVIGGLYHVIVTLEKSSQGLDLRDDIKFDLFVSVSHSQNFVADAQQGQQNIVIKTYYDDVTDFGYQNGTISFEMPFNWDAEYIKLVSVLHMEVLFPKTIRELQTNSYSGTLNGVELRPESIQIDDYSSENDRTVHFVLSNAHISRIAEGVQEQNNTAVFSLKPTEKPKFPLDLNSQPLGKYLLQLSWEPGLIETGVPISFVMTLRDPNTDDLARRSSFDFVITQDGSEMHRRHLSSDLGTYSYKYTFPRAGTATLSASNINGEGEFVEINLVVLQGTGSPVQPSPGPSGCLIATAAFGSELSPQVQYLRSFRENYVLATASGNAFMSVFNSLYYSFSPQIADYERENPWLQTIVRMAVYPLLGILNAAERAHFAAGGGEAGMVVAGAMASTLIGAFYLMPAGILMCRRIPTKTLMLIVVAAITVLAMTLAIYPTLLPVSTSAFVLAVAGASAILAGKVVHRGLMWK
jgi:peptide/nickel transport system substrate-binding protein